MNKPTNILWIFSNKILIVYLHFVQHFLIIQLI